MLRHGLLIMGNQNPFFSGRDGQNLQVSATREIGRHRGLEINGRFTPHDGPDDDEVEIGVSLKAHFHG